MHPTWCLRAPPGFWKRSLNEFQRLSRIAVKFEALERPNRPYQLIRFNNPDSIDVCKRMSDMDIGGYSSSHLDYVAPTDSDPAHARFHGNISLELPLNNPEIARTGFAGFRTIDRQATLFGKNLWEIDPYTYLALKIKSDGRKYFVNVQTDSIVMSDLHQHLIYAKYPGQWETVLINFYDFVRTNHGMRVEPANEMLRMKVRSVGISLLDRKEAPFDLKIAGFWAVNALGDLEAELARVEEDEASKMAAMNNTTVNKEAFQR